MNIHGFKKLISHVKVSVYRRNSNFPTQHSCFNWIKVGKSDCSVLGGLWCYVTLGTDNYIPEKSVASIFGVEDAGNRFLWNKSNSMQEYMAL